MDCGLNSASYQIGKQSTTRDKSRIYNINKLDLKAMVYKLTGPPALYDTPGSSSLARDSTPGSSSLAPFPRPYHHPATSIPMTNTVSNSRAKLFNSQPPSRPNPRWRPSPPRMPPASPRARDYRRRSASIPMTNTADTSRINHQQPLHRNPLTLRLPSPLARVSTTQPTMLDDAPFPLPYHHPAAMSTSTGHFFNPPPMSPPPPYIPLTQQLNPQPPFHQNPQQLPSPPMSQPPPYIPMTQQFNPQPSFHPNPQPLPSPPMTPPPPYIPMTQQFNPQPPLHPNPQSLPSPPMSLPPPYIPMTQQFNTQPPLHPNPEPLAFPPMPPLSSPRVREPTDPPMDEFMVEFGKWMLEDDTSLEMFAAGLPPSPPPIQQEEIIPSPLPADLPSWCRDWLDHPDDLQSPTMLLSSTFPPSPTTGILPFYQP